MATQPLTRTPDARMIKRVLAIAGSALMARAKVSPSISGIWKSNKAKS